MSSLQIFEEKNRPSVKDYAFFYKYVFTAKNGKININMAYLENEFEPRHC
jgi:hypothetical protein